MMISVLCVDDEPGFLYLIKTFLEKTGEFIVGTAVSAQEAQGLLQANQYDIIVSDYLMPGIDGLSFLRSLRKQGNHLPFILLSCHGQELEIVEAINDGLSGYASKEGNPLYTYTLLSHRIKQVVSLQKTEDRWKESEERFRLLYTHMAEGVALFTLVRNTEGFAVDFRFEMVNPQYEKLFYTSSESVNGRLISEVIGFVPCLDACARVVETGDPAYFEKYFAGPSKYYAISVSPWLSNGFAMIFSDITRRVKAEERLLEMSQYLQKLITHAGTPIIVWDSDGRVNQFNQAFEILTGYSRDEIMHMPITSIFPEDQANRLFSLIHLTRLGMHLESAEIPVQTKTGVIRLLQWNSSNIQDPDGSLRATIAIGLDITRQRELEEENATAVIQLKKNIAELAILNDGIRNPLAVILASAELTGEDTYSRITHQVWEIDRMIDQLDSRWIESEKILKFLEKHCRIGFTEGKNEGLLQEQVSGTDNLQV